MALALY